MTSRCVAMRTFVIAQIHRYDFAEIRRAPRCTPKTLLAYGMLIHGFKARPQSRQGLPEGPSLLFCTCAMLNAAEIRS